MSGITLHEGDNRESLRRLIDQGVRVHSVVCDPPYGMTSVTKRFGGDKAAPAKFGTDGAFSRASAGFMGSKWDGTGIERDPEFWALVYEILLPGGYCVAFSAARTGHWQACAMELAGFIMHPFLGWVYGQGFPKAHNASKAIDKELGCERPVIGVDQRYVGMSDQAKRGCGEKAHEYSAGWVGDPSQITGPGSPEAAQWDGWAYGAQSLKPALEPIYVGQKPFSEKNGALNLLKHGVGAVNIDGCRVGYADGDRVLKGGSYGGNRRGGAGESMFGMGGAEVAYDESPPPLGRHPANLLHDGSPEVLALFPESKGQQGDVRGTEPSHTGDENTHCYGEYGRVAAPKRGDNGGSAARFFNSFPPIHYHGKATKADRAGSKHPTVKPVALMRWLCRLVTPPGGTVLDPFAGSGTTGAAALAEGFDCVLMEAEPQFIADIRRRFDLPSEDDFAALLTAPEDDFTALLG